MTNQMLVKPKLLIVDDNSEMLGLITKILERNYELDGVQTGEEAIEKVNVKIYDLILMDINLGIGINGVQTTKLIRDISSYKSIPIIAITAYEKEHFSELSNEKLFQAYLQKPFSLVALQERIKASL